MRKNGIIYGAVGDEQVSATEEHIIVLGEILEQMARGRREDFYSEYVPHMNLDRQPPNRKLVSEVLGYIWRRCVDNMFPELNYMLISKRTGLPGKYMQERWIHLYGTKTGYEPYCRMRSREAARMLDHKLIVINLEGMLRRE
jgi:hypothetical protein